MLADGAGQPCKKRGSPIPPLAPEVKRTGFGGKSDDVTQGDLIVPAEAVNLAQGCEGQGKIMDGEKSDVGIVARKFARKAAKANETAL